MPNHDYPVDPGTIVYDFRGNPWRFVRMSRIADQGRSAKVEVADLDTGTHSEFYASVFNIDSRWGEDK